MLGNAGVSVGVVTSETRFLCVYHGVKKLGVRTPPTIVYRRQEIFSPSQPPFGNLVACVSRREWRWDHHYRTPTWMRDMAKLLYLKVSLLLPHLVIVCKLWHSQYFAQSQHIILNPATGLMRFRHLQGSPPQLLPYAFLSHSALASVFQDFRALSLTTSARSC